MSFTYLDAIKIMHDVRYGTATNVADAFSVADVQATLLDDRTLVLIGATTLRDWLDYGVNVEWGGAASCGFPVVPGDSGTLYHGGFLEYAQYVFCYAKAAKPKFIIGHSLGGAAAQIVGASLGVPALTFGSPAVTSTSERLDGEGWVQNVFRPDDPIYNVLLPFGFRLMGSQDPVAMVPSRPGGFSHTIPAYLETLQSKANDGDAKRTWPRS
ncbi:MAG: hypothetical protein AAGF78_05890 [Pseudomonadota bacterium]